MKLKLTTVLDSTEGLKALTSLPLKAKTSFRLSKLIKVLDSHLETFQESRKNVIDKYKAEETDEDGNVKLVIPAETIEEYSKEITELLQEEINVEVPEITLDDLEDVAIEARHLSSLDWLILE